MHSSAYQNASQIPPGPVLIVGGGNSGGEIAEELSPLRPVHLSVGRRIRPVPAWLRGRVWPFRLARYRNIHARNTLLPWPLGARRRFQIVDIDALGREGRVSLRPRAVAAGSEEVRFHDGRALRVASVIWATGYRPDYSWIQVDGSPEAIRATPGLHFLGEFLMSLSVHHAEGVAEAVERFAASD